MSKEQHTRNDFKVYRATVNVHLGPIQRSIPEGGYLETDGSTVRYDGETFSMPAIKGSIEQFWFVPEGDQTGNGYISQPANLQMHSAVPNRDGSRQTFQMGLTQEDHHVVGSVQGAQLGAASDRTRKVRASSQAVAPLQQQWMPQQQDGVPDLNLGGHEPLYESDPRYLKQRVDARQISHREMVETLTGQYAEPVVAIPPTQKAADESTRRALTRRNSHMVGSAMTQAENRSQARVLHSRAIQSERLAAKARQMQGQAVGVNGLSQPGGPRYQGGDFNQQEPQVVRTVSGQHPPYQQPQHPPQQYQQPVPQQQVPPPSSADYQDYLDFLAFKAMKARAEQQGRQAHQAGLAQAHTASMQAPVVVVDWATESAGVQWAKRARLAVEKYGSDAATIQSILDQEASEGARKEIRRRMGWDEG